MIALLSLAALKWICAGALFLCVAMMLYVVQTDPDSLAHRYYLRYVAYLDRKLRNMLLTTRGRTIAAGQLFALALTLLACFTLSRWAACAIPIVLFGPALYIEQMRRSRVAQIDRAVDGFMLTLANALRATPSIGNALSYTQDLVPEPMNDEVGLALQELRLGNSLDQALLNMGGRIQSAPLDSALAALLIGRQVGGDLTKVLETTAATLRELARLQGFLRSKTAESKAQMLVMAVFPGLIIGAFEWLSPGYFAPLFQSWIGWFVMIAAAILWAVSLIVAQQVLAVEL